MVASPLWFVLLAALSVAAWGTGWWSARRGAAEARIAVPQVERIDDAVPAE